MLFVSAHTAAGSSNSPAEAENFAGACLWVQKACYAEGCVTGGSGMLTLGEVQHHDQIGINHLWWFLPIVVLQRNARAIECKLKSSRAPLPPSLISPCKHKAPCLTHPNLIVPVCLRCGTILNSTWKCSKSIKLRHWQCEQQLFGCPSNKPQPPAAA